MSSLVSSAFSTASINYVSAKLQTVNQGYEITVIRDIAAKIFSGVISSTALVAAESINSSFPNISNCGIDFVNEDRNNTNLERPDDVKVQSATLKTLVKQFHLSADLHFVGNACRNYCGCNVLVPSFGKCGK